MAKVISPAKITKIKPFEKVLNVLLTGKPTSREEIDALVGKEIYMYRISNYIYCCKIFADAVIRVNKSGRKVSSYQLMNVDTAKKYLIMMNALLEQSGVAKLTDLGVEPAVVEEAVAETETA
jgi:hypothetical protein